MFIITAKISKKRLLLGLVALGAVAWGICALTPGSREVSAGEGEETISAIALAAKNLKTNEDRVAYLKECGWEVDPASGTLQEVLIPKTFDEVYTAYNELQKKQGFDLEKWQGKRVSLATYQIVNYPEGKQATVSLLLDKHRVIAGDISSEEQGGFVHGLTESLTKEGDAKP